MSKCDYRCEKATPDDIDEVAKYIHMTDPYIYPIICPEPDDEKWRNFIGECLTSPKNIYASNNLLVVKCNDKVIGVACVMPCGIRMHFTEGIVIPEELKNGMNTALEGYFKPLLEESEIFEGYNIVNVCIDEKYRGQGAGEFLVRQCVEQYGHATMHLDVIASNKAAVKVYEKCGFRIKNEYIGFSGDDSKLLCYHMVREKQ